VIRPSHFAAALLLVSTSAFATVGGPNRILPFGVDEAGKVYLREDVGGETGQSFGPSIPPSPASR
jgi:hypothetical protein